MNPALEKMLREFEQLRLYGNVEISYQNGVPVAVHVKKTYKLSSAERPALNRETRGDQHGQSESRSIDR